MKRLGRALVGGLSAAIVVALLMSIFDVHLFRHSKGTLRVTLELGGMSSVLENYRADFGAYPHNAASDALRPNATFQPDDYVETSRLLYQTLAGDSDGDPKTPPDGKVYFEFPPAMLKCTAAGIVICIVDPFGKSYGYSTHKAANPTSAGGNNAAFDLWSTGGGTTERDRKKWFTNW